MNSDDDAEYAPPSAPTAKKAPPLPSPEMPRSVADFFARVDKSGKEVVLTQAGKGVCGLSRCAFMAGSCVRLL